jgi:DNA-binding MarR family transcriptional regulator
MMKSLPHEQELQHFREMLQILVRRFGLLEKEGAQCCGVTLVQSHVLFEIGRRENVSLGDLSAALGLDNSTLSRHIQGLVEKGWVTRTPSETDRRYVTIGLTEQGREYERQIARQMCDYMQEILSHVPEEKRAQVLESIDLLLEAMRKSNCCRCC